MSFYYLINILIKEIDEIQQSLTYLSLQTRENYIFKIDFFEKIAFKRLITC